MAIIGAGIIGLATAFELTLRQPKLRIAVLEKDAQPAGGQTGHNSGVIHSGIYYKPGSHKANFCIGGVTSLLEFCREHDIAFQQCGKVVVATHPSELPRLEALFQRGQANGVKGLELIGPDRLQEIEPFSTGIKAIFSPTTGIIDFTEVAKAFMASFQERGGILLTKHRLRTITVSSNSLELGTTKGPVTCRYLINCAGLYADSVARMMGGHQRVRIIPFRGEYYTLQPHARKLVRGLIYPVPDPNLPFLGVHFTRNIHGSVEAGPNAILALAREGYRKRDIQISDTFGILTYPGFWRMARKYWKTGISEMYRSVRKKIFLRDLQRLLPAITGDDLAPGGSGVRAQAVGHDGAMLDDFSIQVTRNAIHVLNAPSPGATSSLAIGRHLTDLAQESFNLQS